MELNGFENRLRRLAKGIANPCEFVPVGGWGGCRDLGTSGPEGKLVKSQKVVARMSTSYYTC